ncbi:MAG: oxidoreductase, partial [Actinobacteria bacterium]|nr:oxidoreductase [Actinomycetota bacterium]
RDAYVAMARLTADRALASGRLSAELAERLLSVLASSDAPGDVQ